MWKQLRNYQTMSMLHNTILLRCMFKNNLIHPRIMANGNALIYDMYRRVFRAARKRILAVPIDKNPRKYLALKDVESAGIHSAFDTYSRNSMLVDSVYEVYKNLFDELKRAHTLLDMKITLNKGIVGVDHLLTQADLGAFYTQLKQFETYNGFFVRGKYITLLDMTSMLFTMRDFTKSTYYATGVRILAHELGHSYITPYWQGLARNCTIEHYQETCEIFIEVFSSTNPHSFRKAVKVEN
ncbi:unnamed protein product, partial [Mesorhabditis spiculigera]